MMKPQWADHMLHGRSAKFPKCASWPKVTEEGYDLARLDYFTLRSRRRSYSSSSWQHDIAFHQQAELSRRRKNPIQDYGFLCDINPNTVAPVLDWSAVTCLPTR
jgi:hypothetical protein